MTSQERARRQRWKRGIERSWKDDGDVPSMVSGDESTFGYSAVSGSYASGGSVDTDYTTEGSSDESGAYPSAKGRGGESRRGNSSTGDLWSGVTEDLGIIAGLLLSDGTACVGGVAAITHETVVDSCQTKY